MTASSRTPTHTEGLDLTVVVPCYNEATHIRESARELFRCLGLSRLRWEVMFIDDGSQDATRDLLQDIVASRPEACVVFNERNLGRGATVTKGIRLSTARVAGFLDIDLSTSPMCIPYLAELLLSGEADVASAQRIYKIEPAQTLGAFHRVALSVGYRRLSQSVLHHGLKDTETGCKFFSREAILPVLEQVEDPHWFWDTEVMILSLEAGLRLVEVPTLYLRSQKPSTVAIFKDVAYYLKKLFEFRSRLNALRKP